MQTSWLQNGALLRTVLASLLKVAASAEPWDLTVRVAPVFAAEGQNSGGASFAASVANNATAESNVHTNSSSRAEEVMLRGHLVELRREREAAEAAAKSSAEIAAVKAQQLKGSLQRVRTMRAELSLLAMNATNHQRYAHEVNESLAHSKMDKLMHRWEVLPHQRAMAAAVGFFGALSVVGPSSYTRPFLALTGSAVGGLLVAVATSFCAAAVHGDATWPAFWLHAALQLIGGQGDLRGYVVWLTAVVLGTIRYCVMWDRRDYDVYWPSHLHCGRSRPPAKGVGKQRPAKAEREPAGSLEAATPATEAPFMPAFSKGNLSSRLPALLPPPPLTRPFMGRR
mmetsp:Transcript_58638/g.136356  ORF Transcript_58638/g.136356 Transcript_58638/m.136356 type:complete len:340 (+) Transcript_58638:82-1101(+)